MAKVPDWGLQVSKFKLQLRYYIHFQANTLEKGMNPSIPLSMALNKIKLATMVQGNQKAPFSVATTLRCRGGRYSFPLIVLYSHDHYTYTYTCRNIFNTIKMNGDTSLEKYTSHFIWKGSKGLLKVLLCERWVGDWTELQHIDPHSYGYNNISFPFSCAAQLGAWGRSGIEPQSPGPLADTLPTRPMRWSLILVIT